MNPRIVIIGLVWPEPTSSAAGWRMLQIIDQLKKLSNDIHFACAASKSDASYPLTQLNVNEYQIQLNSSSFDEFIVNLNPDVVVYDRFITEEQFGWRVKKALPNCITILDTEDLHFVRRARAEAYKKNKPINLDTVDCYRELSSIYRCDLSIIISKSEYELLINQYKISEKQLLYLPFIESDKPTVLNKLAYKQRNDLMFIGNMLHEPNYQTVLQLKKLWGQIRKQLPNTELHIYGAYISEKIMQLHNVNDKFLIKGKADDVNQTMQQYRVLAAPIPFGAGLKGKFVDGYRNSLPNVTTKVGAEGFENDHWGGFISDDETQFVNDIAKLYTNETLWIDKVKLGYQILTDQFSYDKWNGVLKEIVLSVLSDVNSHRSDLFIQKILWQNTMQATKYMSLWIETKNK